MDIFEHIGRFYPCPQVDGHYDMDLCDQYISKNPQFADICHSKDVTFGRMWIFGRE
jgi:hypothetical protein